MTYYGATFWVGANAVIRKRALEDIVEVETTGGFEIRTLHPGPDRHRGHRVQHRPGHPRLDPGELPGTAELQRHARRTSVRSCVQRRRWANGGLLILPKLWAQLRQQRSERRAILSARVLLRVNYMASIAWASFGLVFLLAYPYDSRLLSPIVFLAALPYFLAMGSRPARLRAPLQRHPPHLRLQPGPAAGQPCRRAESRCSRRSPATRSPSSAPPRSRTAPRPRRSTSSRRT